MRGGERAMRRGEVRLVALQRAVLVAPGNVGAAEHAGGATLDAAGAVLGKLCSVGALHDPAGRSLRIGGKLLSWPSSSIAADESNWPLCESWIYLDNQIN